MPSPIFGPMQRENERGSARELMTRLVRSKNKRTYVEGGNSDQRLSRIKQYVEEEYKDTQESLESVREEHNCLSEKRDWLETKRSLLEYLKEMCS